MGKKWHQLVVTYVIFTSFIHMIKALAENIFMLVFCFFCIWNQNLHTFYLLVFFSFGLFPQHHNISLWLLCMGDLKQHTIVVSKLGNRQGHVLEESSRLWICLSAGICLLPCEMVPTKRFLLCFREVFCAGRHSLSCTAVLLVPISWATLLWGCVRVFPRLLQILSSPAWFQAGVEKMLQWPTVISSGESENNSSMFYIPGHTE